ncbi:MAG: hypothetical protein NT007_04175 [Candidatus Kapabacteria bacterium]|nr:hypothetical protein [Candidatus Kapabacteria bacterium]
MIFPKVAVREILRIAQDDNPRILLVLTQAQMQKSPSGATS